jgi:3-mercaptopyruvate sulfurtransferase SseA
MSEETKFEWTQAPTRTQWGDGMMQALVALDNDSTLSLYCHKDDAAKVAGALARLLDRQPDAAPDAAWQDWSAAVRSAKPVPITGKVVLDASTILVIDAAIQREV